ncbi:cobalt transport protein CbiN [Lachnospiraceae bacterium 46-61]
MSKKNKITMLVLFLIMIVLIVFPILALKNAEFGGSDDAGSVMIEKINGKYEPWFTPVLEKYINGEIPGEIESLLFCIQTALGVGVIAFYIGRFVERKKWEQKK